MCKLSQPMSGLAASLLLWEALADGLTGKCFQLGDARNAQTVRVRLVCWVCGGS